MLNSHELLDLQIEKLQEELEEVTLKFRATQSKDNLYGYMRMMENIRVSIEKLEAEKASTTP